MQDPHSLMLKETFTEFSKNHHEFIKFLSEIVTSNTDLARHAPAIHLKLKLWMDDITHIKCKFLMSYSSFAGLETIINYNIYIPYLTPPKGEERELKNPDTIMKLISDLRKVFYSVQSSVADLIKVWDLGYLKEQVALQNSLNNPPSAVPKTPGSFFP